MTMWIPTPSMTLPQRAVLYGTCILALVNSVGLLVLMVQQNQQRAWLERTESRLTEVEQSSVVEFLQEVPKGAAALRAEPLQQQFQYQNSRNKRSEEREKELPQEPHHEEVHEQEVSQEVGEQAERKLRHKHRLSQNYHKTHVQEDMMMMMTYSMVPVRVRISPLLLLLLPRDV